MVHKGSLFSTFLPTLVISCLFDDGHSNRCEVISRGFDLHFLMISDIEQLFMHLLAILMSSLGKCLFTTSTYFFLKNIYLFIFGCVGSLLLRVGFP